MTIIGEAFVAVKPDTTNFGPEAEKSVLGSVTKIAKAAGAAIGGAFVVKKGLDFLGSAVADARESNKIAAQTAAVIKSTGAAAQVSAKQVDQLATSISNKTGVDDEEIAKAENLLLTFTNVRNEAGKGNDVFNQATKTLVDMGAALGTDAAGSAIQLGKALNDPVKGIAALTRVGVTFTDQQKEQIKSMVAAGKTADAQKIILAELGKEFGGSAAAQATASDRLSVSIGNIKEDIGNKLIPVIDKVAKFLADNLPGAIDKTGAFFSQLGKTVGPVIANIISGFEAFVGFIQRDVVPVVEAVVGRISEVFGHVAESVSQRLGPVVEAVQHVIKALEVVIGVALAPLIVTWKLWGDQIKQVVTIVFGTIRDYIEQVLRVIGDVIDVVLAVINGDWGKAWNALQDIPKAVFSALRALIEGELRVLVTIVASLPSKLLALVGVMSDAGLAIGKAILTGLGKGIAGAAAFVGDIGSAVVKAIKDFINKQVIDRVNRALEIKIHGPGFLPDIKLDPPDIPHLAGGAVIKARAGGVIANIGEGRTDEAVLPLPPGLLTGLQALADAARAGDLFGRRAVQIIVQPGADVNTGREVVAELRTAELLGVLP